MFKVALSGGGYSKVINTNVEMQLFFDCIKHCMEDYNDENNDLTLITDRLYKRYVRQEDFEKTIDVLKIIENVFKQTSSKVIDWGDVKITGLDKNKKTLYEIFEKYFDIIYYIEEVIKLDLKNLDYYGAIQIRGGEMFHAIMDKQRPLSFFDELEGEPIWLRPDEFY